MLNFQLFEVLNFAEGKVIELYALLFKPIRIISFFKDITP
jgi:hypothetical protein